MEATEEQDVTTPEARAEASQLANKMDVELTGDSYAEPAGDSSLGHRVLFLECALTALVEDLINRGIGSREHIERITDAAQVKMDVLTNQGDAPAPDGTDGLIAAPLVVEKEDG